MATTTTCPIDPALSTPANIYLFAGDVVSVPLDPPPPTPGDPDVTYVPATPRSLGRRVQLMLTEPTTHKPLALVETAQIETCSFGFGPGQFSASASSADPAWEVAGSRSTTAYGRTVHDPDLRGVDWCIGVDGVRFSSGVFAEPQRIQAGWALSGDSAEAVLDERALGETEQRDYYGGRGSFPTDSFAGWSKTPNVSWSWNTSDPYEGARSLRVQAVGATAGRVYGPWVEMPGQPGQTRYPVASALVRIDSDLVMQVLCEVQSPDGTPVSPQFTLDERGVSDDSDSDWQGPVRGRGRLAPTSAVHRVRAVLVIPASGDDVDIDLVRLQWPTLTGYPSKRDLSYYPARILRDAQFGPGGSSWGIVTTVLDLSGVERKLTYPHQDDIPVGQAMNGIREMASGPDWWITPGWRCLVGNRGSVRFDFALTPDNIIDCEMAPDPGGQVDEFRGVTNLGSGSFRHVHGVNQRTRRHRRRVRQIVSVPEELNYDAGLDWTRGQAATAAQEPWTATATIPFDEGLAITEGDVVSFAWVDGDSDDAAAYWGSVRIGGRVFDFQADVCRVSVSQGGI